MKNFKNNSSSNNGTTKEQQRNTNNNINNNIYYLFNKYKGQFSIFQTSEEKVEIFKQTCMKDDIYEKLTQEDKTEIYTRLLSIK